MDPTKFGYLPRNEHEKKTTFGGEPDMAGDVLLPVAHQTIYNKVWDVLQACRNKVAGGVLSGHARGCPRVVGIMAASVAVTGTGLAGGTASPAAAFGLYTLLLGGLSLVILHVLGS